VISQVNDQNLKVAKLKGEFVWHDYADDECGILLIETVTTAHTGTVLTDRTVPVERQLG
jgi:hypothetical protein